MKIDTEWFNDMIRRSPYGSQRRLSRKIRGRRGHSLDPAAISLMLRGKRSMQLHEARQFADLLDVPLVEVLRRAGLPVPEDGAKSVPVMGHIDKNGELVMYESAKDAERIPGHSDLPADAIAVRFKTARSEHDLLDGWLLYAAKPGQASADVIGRFSLVAPRNGRPMMGFVLRGYKPGTYNLATGLFFGQPRQVESILLDWIAPIIWIKA